MALENTVEVIFRAITGKLSTELNAVDARLQRTGKEFVSFGSAATAGLAALGGLAITNFLKGQAEAADALGKQADRIKESTTALKAYQIAAQDAGVSVEQANKLLQDAQKRLGEAATGTGKAAQYIKDLGLNIDELKKKSPTELFSTYASAIGTLKDRSEQLAAANALMGKGAIEAFNLIQEGAPALAHASALVERYGLALSRVEIKQIEAANDSVARLGVVSQAAGQRIVAGLAPFIDALSQSLLNATGNTITLQERAQQFGAVVYTAFQIAANTGNVLEAAFYGLAGSIAKVLQVITASAGKALELAANVPGSFRAVLIPSAVALKELSTSLGVSADANLSHADASLQQVQSIADIQEGIVRLLESSRQRAEESVSAMQAADAAAAAGGRTLGGESVALAAQDTSALLAQIAAGTAQQQKDLEREVTEYTQRQLDERVYATNAANDAMAKRAQDQAKLEMSLRQEAANAGVGAIKLLAVHSKTFAKISKGLDIAMALRNTYVAVTNALKSGDPYTAIPRAIALGAFGFAQVRAIMKTPDEASYASVTTIGSGGGPVGGVNPTFASGGGEQQTQGAQSARTVQVIIQGNMVGNRQFLDEMISRLGDAINDRDVVVFSSTSRQSRELVGA